MSNIIFDQIQYKPSVVKELYELLDSRKHRISHEKLPSFEKHNEFVLNHPYRYWWIVRLENKAIGSVYITYENGIGINLKLEDISLHKEVITKTINEFTPLPPIPSVRPEFFFVNTAPTNTSLIEALECLGCKESQKTYVL
jgi:hypothetical protein